MNARKNVYIDGVFDLFHEGHINFLKAASSYGFLIVGVHDDEFVMSYKRKPYMPEKTRYEVVKSCRYVDQVIEGIGLLTEEMIHSYSIELVLHGDDFNMQDAIKYYKPALDKGIFQFLKYTEHVSSTKILKLIEERFVNSKIS